MLFLLVSNIILSQSCQIAAAPLEATIVLDNLRLLTVNDVESSITVSFNFLLEWAESKKKTGNTSKHQLEPKLLTDNLLSSHLANEHTEVSDGGTRYRCFTRLSIQCEPFDLTSYPFDTQSCQLTMTSSGLNSSLLLLVPHVINSKKLGNSNWDAGIRKSFVQWVTTGEESFEMAVFSLSFKRGSSHFSFCVWILFLLNTLSISYLFPFVSLECKGLKESKMGGIVLLFEAVICCFLVQSSTVSLLWTTGMKLCFAFCLHSLVCCVLSSLAPSVALSLHCVPYEAHPLPSDLPTPHEQFSLDSERTRLSCAFDSARLDSSRTSRTANIELCMAELKYTLSSLNEALNAKSNSQWRKRLWSVAYGRIRIALAVVLHAINVIILFCASG